MVFCPECGQDNAPGAKFCRHCGASLAEASQPVPEPASTPAPSPELSLPQEDRVCRSCGTIAAPDEKFCGNCGTTLKAVPPVVPAPLPPSTRPCPECGSVMNIEMKFCGECGASMTKKPVPTPPPTPTPAPAPAAALEIPLVVSPPPHVTPKPVPPVIPVSPPGTRPCRTCGNPVYPGAKYCSKCCAMVTDTPAPAPAPVTMPPLPVVSSTPGTGQTCMTCGNPVSDTEKFCGECGTPVVRAPPSPPPAPPTAAKFCGACGAPVRETAKFCNLCGAPAGGPPAQPGTTPFLGTTPAAAAPVSTTPPGAGSAEAVLGVIGNAKKMKMFGASYDTYSIVVTNRRMIFAHLTQALTNAAIMEAQAKAKAEGKGFFGIVQDQMAASFGFALRYEKMSPDQTLAETTGNSAIENTRITAIKMQLKDSGNLGYNEFKTVIESMDGKFEYIIAEDERFTNLLRTVYGERLHMPFGYFSKAGVRIKFF